MSKFTATIAFAGLLAASAPAAHALPQFTFNPAGAGLAGTSFTADNIILSDFATVTFSPGNNGQTNFTDNGVLAVVGFQLNNAPVTVPGLNSTFGLYFQFTGAGVQNTPNLDGTTSGVFTSLNYTLNGYNVTGPVTYSPSGSTPTGVSNPVTLGVGQLISGGVGATIIPGVAIVPNANTLLAFAAQRPAFFVEPSPFFNADFAAFTNNPSQIGQTSNGFTITGGGGSANFLEVAVPEPLSMGLFGLGIVGAFFVKRRQPARSTIRA